MNNHLHHLNHLEKITILARKKATGTPKTLSRRLEISPSTVYLYINRLQKIGIPISYNKEVQSYVIHS